MLGNRTYTVVVLGLASLTAGVTVLGHDPLVGLSGRLFSPGTWALLALSAWECAAPALGFAAHPYRGALACV
ncbi:MAG TPA: hypothetical protein VGN37_12290 [Actinocatenispora sp.]